MGWMLTPDLVAAARARPHQELEGVQHGPEERFDFPASFPLQAVKMFFHLPSNTTATLPPNCPQIAPKSWEHSPRTRNDKSCKPFGLQLFHLARATGLEP